MSSKRITEVLTETPSSTPISETTPPNLRVKATPNLPELTISLNSPTTPTLADVSTSVPIQGAVEATPKAAGGFSVPTPSSGRFNPKNFVRKLSGFTGTGSAPSSPGVEATAVAAPPLAQRSASKDRRLFSRTKSATGGYSSSSGASSGGENTTPMTLTPASPSASSVGLGGKRRESYYEYKRGNDIMGIVMLEIQGADNLPRLANSGFQHFRSLVVPN